MIGEFTLEFFGGPGDGDTLTVEIPPGMEGAPEHVDILVGPSDPTLWADQIAPGTVVDRYRAPAGDEELLRAEAAFADRRPVKYVYTGRVET